MNSLGEEDHVFIWPENCLFIFGEELLFIGKNLKAKFSDFN
jgi:hypothetical protein